MRLLLDENAPKQWLPLLRDQGHDSVHVIDRGWAGAEDRAVFAHALDEERILLTRNGFKRNPAKREALEAMCDGLRIIRVTAKGLKRMIRAVAPNIEYAEQAFTQDSMLRRLTIMNDYQVKHEYVVDLQQMLEDDEP